MRLDDVLDTAERFDVAGFGEILAVTTYLTGALIGKRVSINKSAWAGYSSGYATCEVVGSDTARRVAARKASAPQQAARKAERREVPQGIEDDISCDGYAMTDVHCEEM